MGTVAYNAATGQATVGDTFAFAPAIGHTARIGVIKVQSVLNTRSVGSLSIAEDIGVVQTCLQKLGYDEINTSRIVNTSENGDQIAIIGENMKRANAVARMVESAGGKSISYNPRNWIGVNKDFSEANRSWLRYWGKDKGIPVIDLGTPPMPRPRGPSPFYGIENRSLNRWDIYTPFSR
jgi:hypothetical protein